MEDRPRSFKIHLLGSLKGEKRERVVEVRKRREGKKRIKEMVRNELLDYKGPHSADLDE